jgi:hypothetical protein
MKIPNIEDELNFKFDKKPLLIGGLAMEFYKLRKAGNDVDFVLDKNDHNRLKSYLDKKGMIYLKGSNTSGFKDIPEFVDLYGDHGLLIHEYEFWNNILLFDYDFLAVNAVEKNNCIIISMAKLLFLKALAMNEPKYL